MHLPSMVRARMSDSFPTVAEVGGQSITEGKKDGGLARPAEHGSANMCTYRVDIALRDREIYMYVMRIRTYVSIAIPIFSKVIQGLNLACCYLAICNVTCVTKEVKKNSESRWMCARYK